jgi:ribosomal protein S18 acetylase RimI-like enzyme
VIEFRGAGPAEFAERLDTVIDIYTAAMHPPVDQITGRRAIMRNHGTYPNFQCYFAELRDPPETFPGERGGHRTTALRGEREEDPRTSTPRTVGFAYGFRGAPGQWWHDVVFRALEGQAGREAAEAWLGDAFELAEIHMHPDYQGKGIGRAMITTLCAGRRERSAVLSTHDHPTVARHLYASMGFTDLLTQFVFPGGYEHYAIVGRPLPLP